MEQIMERDRGQQDYKITVHLIGEFRISLKGIEVNWNSWRNRKAVQALIYLLLSPKYRVTADHLFYSLWPRRKLSRKNVKMLYHVVWVIRKNIPVPRFLIKRYDFYQLEDVWTDLGELENLMLRADATQDTAERNEILSRARELARGELLPEFSYDSYVDEHRQYYERLRKKVFGE